MNIDDPRIEKILATQGPFLCGTEVATRAEEIRRKLMAEGSNND